MALFVLTLIPALVIGPILGQNSLLFHSHGDTEGHVHVVREEVSTHVGAIHVGAIVDEHDQHHEFENYNSSHDFLSHETETQTGGTQQQSTRGILIKFALDHLAQPPNSHASIEAPAYVRLALFYDTLWQLNCQRCVRQKLSSLPERSPPSVNRSGIAALLLTSRAILV